MSEPYVAEQRAIALALLKKYRRATEEQRTTILRALAEALVSIRGEFPRPDGTPDWKGRSYAYRVFVRDLYDEAGISREEQPTVQAAVRYHVSSFLRERLDDETLAEYELIPKSARERSQDRREGRSAMISALTSRDIAGGALLAISASYRLLSRLVLDDLDGLGQKEREIADATLLDIERRARLLRKRLNQGR